MIKQTFKDKFGVAPSLSIQAPGRINLIGEHTDYNDGFVLPAAVNKGIHFALNHNDTGKLRIYSIDFDDYWESDIQIIEKTDKGWGNYIMGTLQQFQKRSIPLSGIDCVVGGDIPIGSGMSSSAALVCGFATGLNKLFKADLSQWDIAKLGRQVENEFVGTACGIMDQFASVFGKTGHAMLLDCGSLDFEYVPVDLEGHTLVLINTMVKHQNTNSGYNDRPAECAEALRLLQEKYPTIQNFKDIETVDYHNYLSEKAPILKKRVDYVFQENRRVLEARNCLEQGNILGFGQLLYASHDGLSTQYEVSCKELDLLVELAHREEITGARMMGGGFGGCTLNLIDNLNINEVVQSMQVAYKEETGLEAEAYFVEIEDGCRVL